MPGHRGSLTVNCWIPTYRGTHVGGARKKPEEIGEDDFSALKYGHRSRPDCPNYSKSLMKDSTIRERKQEDHGGARTTTLLLATHHARKTSRQFMKVSKADFEWASSEGLLSTDQADALWAAFSILL